MWYRQGLMGWLLVVALAAASPANAKLGLSGAFDVYSQDDAGGGWVINRIPARGDMLWGCEDVATVEECKPVPLPDWVPATTLNFIHISEDSMAAWLNVSVPVVGDYLMACFDPEGRPYCEKVDLELRPPLCSLEREWPDYDLVGGSAGAAGGGGPMAGLMGGATSLLPEEIIEPPDKADMWLSGAIKVPGPVNLYACRSLDGEPECKLAIPDWFLIDRENIGFKKVEEVDSADAPKDGVGIMVEEVEEGSAAEDADIRSGDVIVKVGGFTIKNDKHFKGLLMQFPATYSIPIELEGGDRVKIRVKRKPKDDKK